jgi:hypothetical protein
MDSVVLAAGPIHLGLDVSKNKIAVGILRWDERVPDTEMIFNDEASVRRLVNRSQTTPTPPSHRPRHHYSTRLLPATG